MCSSIADISLVHLAFEYWVKWEDCSNLKGKDCCVFGIWLVVLVLLFILLNIWGKLSVILDSDFALPICRKLRDLARGKRTHFWPETNPREFQPTESDTPAHI